MGIQPHSPIFNNKCQNDYKNNMPNEIVTEINNRVNDNINVNINNKSQELFLLNPNKTNKSLFKPRKFSSTGWNTKNSKKKFRQA